MVMKIGLFPGCVMPTEQYGYEMSIRSIFPDLGIKLIDSDNLSCCGAPFKSINLYMQTYLSARNIAIFEMKGLDIFTPCPQCNLSLLEAKHRLEISSSLRERVTTELKEEGLEYQGKANIYHTIDLIYDVIGIDTIKKKVRKKLQMNIACHEGCQTIRYSDIKRPDRAEHPSKMEQIITALGGSTNYYSEKQNCCGGPLMVINKESALTKAGEKLKSVRDRNFDALAIVCPLGGRMLDSKQKQASETIGEKLDLPVFYLTQLIGLAMGKDPNQLGIHLNQSPVKKLLE